MAWEDGEGLAWDRCGGTRLGIDEEGPDARWFTGLAPAPPVTTWRNARRIAELAAADGLYGRWEIGNGN